MKPRKSTAILLSVWVATFVLYVFVKPATPDHSGFSKITYPVSGVAATTAPAR